MLLYSNIEQKKKEEDKMIKAAIPNNEILRLQALKEYAILDTLPEEDYDNITLLASQICGTAISSISLIDKDRQWFKSKIGIEAEETDRENSFCAHAINSPNEILIIEDARQDDRFFDNPTVIRELPLIFYAGVPLVNPQGLAIGTLCVLDNIPKTLSEQQLRALKALSNQVVSLFELRKSKALLEKISNDLKTRNSELEKFANVAAHDIKSPLNNISSLTEILLSDYAKDLDDDAKMMLNMLNTSSVVLRNLVDGILDHSKVNLILNSKLQNVNLTELINETVQLLDVKNEHEFIFEFKDCEILTNKIALQQIFLNLIANAIKYNDKEKVIIKIGIAQSL